MKSQKSLIKMKLRTNKLKKRPKAILKQRIILLMLPLLTQKKRL
jgi:hypothetical protein